MIKKIVFLSVFFAVFILVSCTPKENLPINFIKKVKPYQSVLVKEICTPDEYLAHYNAVPIAVTYLKTETYYGVTGIVHSIKKTDNREATIYIGGDDLSNPRKFVCKMSSSDTFMVSIKNGDQITVIGKFDEIFIDNKEVINQPELFGLYTLIFEDCFILKR